VLVVELFGCEEISRNRGRTGPNILHGGEEDSPQEDIPEEGNERTRRGHVRTCEDI
jgi:hypothetical protein